MPLKSTKKKATKVAGNKIKANGRVWSEKAYKEFRAYQTEFNKNRYRMYGIRLLREGDQDIIKYLDSQDNLNEFFRTIIRADMMKKKKK